MYKISYSGVRKQLGKLRVLAGKFTSFCILVTRFIIT